MFLNVDYSSLSVNCCVLFRRKFFLLGFVLCIRFMIHKYFMEKLKILCCCFLIGFLLSCETTEPLNEIVEKEQSFDEMQAKRIVQSPELINFAKCVKRTCKALKSSNIARNFYLWRRIASKMSRVFEKTC